MGNICGKAEPDNFSQPGRVLGTAPPQGPKTAPVPRKVGGPPRTLGASSTSPRPAGTGPEANDARQKAADAAEASTRRHVGRYKMLISVAGSSKGIVEQAA